VALVLLASAMIGSSFVDSPIELILTWGILAGLALGFATDFILSAVGA